MQAAGAGQPGVGVPGQNQAATAAGINPQFSATQQPITSPAQQVSTNTNLSETLPALVYCFYDQI